MVPRRAIRACCNSLRRRVYWLLRGWGSPLVEGNGILTGVDAPRAAVLRRVGLTALCAVLLASCSSTSDPITRLGLTPQPSAFPVATTADAVAGDATAQAADAATADQPYFIVAEDDPQLPEVASAVPSLQNRPEPVAADAQVPDAIAVATNAPAPAVPSAERFAPGVGAPVAAPVAQTAGAAVAAVQSAPAGSSAFAAPAEKKRSGFFASLFSAPPAQAAPRQAAPRPQAETQRPVFAAAAPMGAATQAVQPLVTLDEKRAPTEMAPLPGVRESALFEIRRTNGTDDDSDVDLYEEDDAPVQLASAAGLARLAPNGLVVQTDHVDVACLKPSLVRVLKQIETHYGKKAIVTSGYRSPPRNRAARGARNSLHMYCAAADIQIEGVTKFELAQYLRTMPGRGGVGTYCHTNSVHVDVGPERDWNWRCRRKKRR
jgi:uncharacterized protein YcbK (DUF882 family)